LWLTSAIEFGPPPQRQDDGPRLGGTVLAVRPRFRVRAESQPNRGKGWIVWMLGCDLLPVTSGPQWDRSSLSGSFRLPTVSTL
jgi:hypothetical protein